MVVTTLVKLNWPTTLNPNLLLRLCLSSWLCLIT